MGEQNINKIDGRYFQNNHDKSKRTKAMMAGVKSALADEIMNHNINIEMGQNKGLSTCN